MEERKGVTVRESSDIAIRKCTDGFLVIGEKFGGDNLRAFSTAEGLIEWLSRELGAGPIVWGLTLEIWRGMAGVGPDDLLPVPDPSVNLKEYREAIEGNAAFLLRKFVETHLKEAVPEPPPEPKPKKEKKVKEKDPKHPEQFVEGWKHEETASEKEKPKE